MHAVHSRPPATTTSSLVGWMLFASLATGIVFALSADALLSSVIYWIPALTFLMYWSGVLLFIWSRLRQQQRRLLWVFALVMGLLYALIIIGFIWYLPLALSLLGSFLALLVTVSFAQGRRPTSTSGWLLLLGCGLLGGTATVLTLWFMLGSGVFTLPMILLLVLTAGLVGPVGGALRWVFDTLWPRLRRGRALNVPEPPPATATVSLSRREVLLGLGGLAGLALTGASFTWLTRSVLAHAFPLVTYQSLGEVKSLSWSPDSKRIVSATDINMAIWDAASGKDIFAPNNDVSHGYLAKRSAVWSPDGTRIALEGASFSDTVGEDTNVIIVEAATLRPMIGISTGEFGASLDVPIAWSPDNTRIATASGEMQVWDAVTGKQLLSLKAGLFMLAWSPDGRALVTDNYHDAQVWDAKSGALLVTYHRHTDFIQTVAWSPDSTKVVTGSFDGTVQVWDARSGRHLLTYGDTADGVLAVAWSPDGRHIASAGFARDIHVWDATTGELVFLYKGHRETVNTLAWSPDGSRVASGSDDETVQIWRPE